ncbi:hypothetical protein AX16_001090 [Volvariella volvacea WC 439]|nr:hypothetical protein AX16_001090 [Volvariella volvacea WC 439]
MKSFKLAAFVLGAVALANAAPPTEAEFKEGVAKGLRLLSLGPNEDPVWKTEEEKLEIIRSDVGFFDVTDVYDPANPFPEVNNNSNLRVAAALAYPTPSRQSSVNPIISTLSITNMQTYLSNLTSFNNRYYRATTGAQASEWIRNTIASIISSGPNVGATVSLVSHSFVQSSIVARFPGTNPNGPLTILGAHMDSINSGNPTSGRAPGADDDGSGSVNLIEAFRALVAAGFRPQDPVEFHWYAGEEGGLLGSQAIATSYRNAGRSVKGMLQLDMTAYFRPGSTEVVGLIPDFTDSSLTSYVAALVRAYLRIGSVVGPACGYGCSDHASWNRQGFPSAFPFEAPFGSHNPVIHSSSDTTSATGFSWTHSLEYAKLAVAFAYELGNSNV